MYTHIQNCWSPLLLLKMAAGIPKQLSIIVSIAMAFSNLSLICTSAANLPLPAATSINSDDTNTTLSALLALKNSISLDPTGFLASWSTSDYCSWRGISCLSGTRHVVSVILVSSQLRGTLTPLLGDLAYLTNLTIYNNSFYGPIPPQLGKLASLVDIDLRMNLLTGSIPPSLANCTRLEILALDSNSLSSQFPPFISKLLNLQYVSFSLNLNITGEIPPDIGHLANLTTFLMYNCSLTGTLPASITNCTKLVVLNLDNNRLSGPIPSDWSKLGSLDTLVLSDNSFVGTIPHTLSNCTKLEVLSLQMNFLVGEIPESLGRLTILQELRLFQNNLTGPIPISIMNCTQLGYLQLGQNDLSGVIPQEIGQLTKLQWLQLSNIAQLAGGIPHQVGECSPMQRLYIEHTKVGGSLPMSLYNLTNMQYLKLSYSGLSGSLDEGIQNFTQLISLRLGGNSFDGQIPAQLGKLKSLQNLELQENNFSGAIPPELSGCTSIFVLNLSNNRLLGTIPPALRQLQTLNGLYLQYNGLSGKIPEMFSGMIRLQSLNLAGNMLTGPIPSSLAALSTLGVLLDMSFNVLSGPIPESMGSLQQLVTLRLSGNRFTGKIPSSLGNCLGMEIVDLSDNQLQSEIPSSLGQMKSLQYLNLSQNELSGSLPPSLGDLPDLVSLNVSYNSLQGMIPSAGKYGHLSSSSFQGNPDLCGYPLPTSCSSVHSAHHYKNIAIIVPVCAVGGGILIATVCACLWWWFSVRGVRGEAATSRDRRNLDSIHGSDGAVLLDIQPPEYKRWTAAELREATNGFDAGNVIGAGGFSKCYRGVMRERNGKKMVAVKRLGVWGSSGAEASRSFVNEVKTLCKVRHRNLVRLEGYCVEGGEVALVMEYMGKGNLHEHLHPNTEDHEEDGRGLSWQARVNVAADVAEALVYLHHENVQPIIHCDVKPTNILLADRDMTAKISDFGIARLVDSGHVPTHDLSNSRFRGTVGYAAPECANGSRLSTKSDVYSYGVLLFELVTELSPTNPQLQEYGMSLHAMINSLQQSGRIREAFGKFLQREIELEPDIIQEASYILNMGLASTSESPKDRPTMRVIRYSINSLKQKRLHKLNHKSTQPQEIL